MRGEATRNLRCLPERKAPPKTPQGSVLLAPNLDFLGNRRKGLYLRRGGRDNFFSIFESNVGFLADDQKQLCHFLHIKARPGKPQTHAPRGDTVRQSPRFGPPDCFFYGLDVRLPRFLKTPRDGSSNPWSFKELCIFALPGSLPKLLSDFMGSYPDGQ